MQGNNIFYSGINGFKIDLKPSEEMLTTPEEFNLMFPGSQGSLYGRTPHGITSTFMRPKNKSKIQFYF